MALRCGNGAAPPRWAQVPPPDRNGRGKSCVPRVQMRTNFGPNYRADMNYEARTSSGWVKCFRAGQRAGGYARKVHLTCGWTRSYTFGLIDGGPNESNAVFRTQRVSV